MLLLPHWIQRFFRWVLPIDLIGSLSQKNSRLRLTVAQLVRGAGLLVACSSFVISFPSVCQAAPSSTLVAALPAGSAVTDPKALLRLSLPINNPTVRELQASVEDITNQLKGKRWSSINGDISKASRLVSDRQAKLLESIPEAQQSQAQSLLEQIDTRLASLKLVAESKDRQQLLSGRLEILDLVGNLEAMMVKGFPFEVPAEYSNLPQLKGRATVLMKTSKGEVTIIADGYSAPVTAGNFVDLVQRGFYNGLEFTRAEQSYVLQAGDPPGKDEGFIDPKTRQYRGIPLEILVKGDSKPLYGVTLEDAGRYLEQPVLPFSAYGTVALARPGEDVNGGSSQFFFLLFEPELTPAGLNLLDGRYAVFGYVVEGQSTLGELREGDKIESAKVIQGSEFLAKA
jgi:peptidylprolyl isomerase